MLFDESYLALLSGVIAPEIRLQRYGKNNKTKEFLGGNVNDAFKNGAVCCAGFGSSATASVCIACANGAFEGAKPAVCGP